MKTKLLLCFLLVLASATQAAEPPMDMAPSTEFSAPWFTANKAHQALGLGSITLATLAVLSPKPDAEGNYRSSAHHQLAVGAAFLGGAAVASGLTFHYKDLNWHKLSDPDNLHALLGTLATVGFAAAIASAPEDTHASAGMIGYASMATAIKITW